MIRPRPSSVFLPAFGLALVALAFLTATQASELRDGFSHPPDSARPHTWWHWMATSLGMESPRTWTG